MRKLLLALAALFSFGCDDATVHANIIDYFVCSYMPSWMGDCQSAAVAEKAESFLSYGFASAQITCSAFLGEPGLGGGQGYHYYQATRLQDGACWASVSLYSNLTSPSYAGQGWSAAQFNVRGTAGANDCAVLLPVPYGTQAVTASDGALHVSDCPPGGSDVCSADINENCSGFNLAAFGVAP